MAQRLDSYHFRASGRPRKYHEGPAEWHFCGWDCLLRHAAPHEPETIIRLEDGP